MTESSLLRDARALSTGLRSEAAGARNAADILGDGRTLADLLEDALRSVPSGPLLRAPEGHKELRAQDEALARAMTRWFRAPLAREAAVRARLHALSAQVLGAAEPLVTTLRRTRAPDAEQRSVALRALDAALDPVAGALLSISASYLAMGEAARPPPPPNPAVAAPLPRQGGLFLATPEVVAALASGVGDLASLIAPPPPSPEPEVPAAPADARQARVSRLADLLRALALAVGSECPSDLAGWRARASAHDVADLSVRPATVFHERSARLRVLPFEAPGVPLARPGAAAAPDGSAWNMSGHLLGLGVGLLAPGLGAALALTAACPVFLRRGLVDAPPDLLRASRAVTLALALRVLLADLGELAAGDPSTLRKAMQDALGGAAPEAWLTTLAAERGLAEAPGEAGAHYVLGGERSAATWRRGAVLADRLRDELDEDWFRNPRASWERLVDLDRSTREDDTHALGRWLQEHAQL